MLEECVIVLHEVTSVGYAHRGQPGSVFGTLEELLADLEQWARGKTLQETNLSGPRAEGDGAYLLDVRATPNGRYLVTLWNPVPATEGQVASVSRDSGVGAAHVVMNEIAEGTIPGYASYFYFVPARRLIACIRFQHRSFAGGNMRSYMRAFLRYCGRHTVLAAEPVPGVDVQVLGYAENRAGAPRRLKPLFDTIPCARDGQIEMLVREAPRITKVVRKTELDLRTRAQAALWQRLLETLNLRPQARPLEPIRLQFTMDGSIDPEEVRSVVADWEAGNLGDSEWDDVGFVLGGDASRTHWLSHSLSRATVNVDVVRDSVEVVNAASLATYLHRHENDILRALR